MLFVADECRRVLATMFAHFQHGGHEPEVVISHHLQHLAGPLKKPCYGFHTWLIWWYVCRLWATTWLSTKLTMMVANRK